MTTKANATDDSFHVFDTTLRDGAQREGINLTVADKLTIARHLDTFGVGYIEGGWPGANPRDTEVLRPGPAGDRVRERPARGVRRDPQGRWQGGRGPPGAGAPELRRPGDHAGRQGARPPCRAGPRTTLEENLEMVRDTVSDLRNGRMGPDQSRCEVLTPLCRRGYSWKGGRGGGGGGGGGGRERGKGEVPPPPAFVK
ncbi:2-isopropylmalate synthase [Streptomyces microflavus]